MPRERRTIVIGFKGRDGGICGYIPQTVLTPVGDDDWEVTEIPATDPLPLLPPIPAHVLALGYKPPQGE